MKKILIVNNNMKVGGVQKSLLNLLWAIYDKYDITLFLFSRSGDYIAQLPESVKVVECTSLFRYLGVSQKECRNWLPDRLIRSILAAICKIFGRPLVIRGMSLSQKKLSEQYDIAISYLQNGNLHSFYGGVNEFVLSKVLAKQKIAWLHCDYKNCGAENRQNNQLYYQFDKIVACSDGCRKSFIDAVPGLEGKCVTVKNFHRQPHIKKLCLEDPIVYEAGKIHVLVVGRLAHEKAVDRAIRAAAYAAARQLPLSLHIVGDGKMSKPLKELTSSLKLQDVVHFYGEQQNPYRFMANADILLVTSYHEAAPMVIDEAYVLGLPVLTVETSSSEEMVLKRHCGWVCENSQEGINMCLIELLNCPSRLGQMKASLENRAADNAEALRQFGRLIGENNE